MTCNEIARRMAFFVVMGFLLVFIAYVRVKHELALLLGWRGSGK